MDRCCTAVRAAMAMLKRRSIARTISVRGEQAIKDVDPGLGASAWQRTVVRWRRSWSITAPALLSRGVLVHELYNKFGDEGRSSGS